MKIAILTLRFGTNYGCLLQAYARSVRPHINSAYSCSVLDRSGSFSRAYARMYDESLLGRIRHKLFRIIGL